MPTPVTQQYTAPDAPKIISPGNGSGIGGTAIKFKWLSPTLNVDAYRLTIGSTVDGTQFHDSGQITATSDIVNGIPFNEPHIYATLYFENSGVTMFRRYEYVGAHPRILTPIDNSELPIGNVPIRWTPKDPLSAFNVVVRGVQSGTVYLQKSMITDLSTFWRPSIADLNAADTHFTVEVTWNSAPLTVQHTFKLHAIPAYDITIDKVKEKVRAFSLKGNILGSSDTLTFPTVINLFRNGMETRFTTSETPLLSQEFQSPLVEHRQGEFMQYVREAGRHHTWMPVPSHTLCGTVMGNVFTSSGEEGMSWLWANTEYVMLQVASTDGYMIVKVGSINANGTVTLVMDGFTNTESGAARVEVCPCFVQIPDFKALSHAGQSNSSVTVQGMEIALDATPKGTASLATLVGTEWVVPILSPFSSRKFVQMVESTPATHSPRYYPIGKQAVDLTSYNYGWGNPEQLTALVNFFLSMKGAQNSFILTDYSTSLKLLSVASATELVIDYASDKYKPETVNFKYITVMRNNVPVSVHKVLGFSFSDQAVQVTLDSALTAEAQTKLASCQYTLCEGIRARFSESSLTMTHQDYGKGSCSLSFSEVVQ